jgi:hypothetical protein
VVVTTATHGNSLQPRKCFTQHQAFLPWDHFASEPKLQSNGSEVVVGTLTQGNASQPRERCTQHQAFLPSDQVCSRSK